MKQMFSQVVKVEHRTSNTLKQLSGQQLEAQRARSVPTVALVSKFDPDQRKFLTGAFQGFSMVQTPDTGTLAINPEYGVILPGQTQPLRMVPGQPVLLYPAAATSPAFSTNFIRGGKEAVERDYPAKSLYTSEYSNSDN